MDKKVFDVIVIGGGIAGLSASICASTEGFSTIVVDSQPNFGGQAGTASLIENLLGFPSGVCGRELIDNSLKQAQKFGVELRSSFNVVSIKPNGLLWETLSENGEVITSKTVVLTIGQYYKKFEAKNLEQFISKGVSYVSPIITEDFSNKTISVIGGANSAGQAAVFLSQCENCNVNLIVRGDTIENTMSHYLYQKIYGIPNIKVFFNTEITECNGVDKLESIKVKTPQGEFTLQNDNLFILIGSKPKTDWLNNLVELDEEGYIKTDENFKVLDGVFCAGDVRSSSLKRVSCALGEGARVVKGIRARIKEISN